MPGFARETNSLVRGKCKNQTKAPKRSADHANEYQKCPVARETDPGKGCDDPKWHQVLE